MTKFVDGFQPVLGRGHHRTDRERMRHLIAQEQQNSDGEDISLPSRAPRPCKSATKNSFDSLGVEEISDQDDGDFTGSINTHSHGCQTAPPTCSKRNHRCNWRLI